MEFSTFQPSSWPFFSNPPLIFPPFISLENYVQWTETPLSHIYTAELPGVKKEEIRVEVEDSIYLIIKTGKDAVKRFSRKFRLPSLIDIGGISAGFEDGVLTVSVPRSRGVRLDLADLPHTQDILAPAA